MAEKLSLEEYLKDIQGRFTGDFSDNGKYNPNLLALNRTGYELSYSETIGPFAVKGKGDIDPRAQEVEKQYLNRLYNRIRKNPNNPETLSDFAKRLVDNCYYELAEEIVGGILMIQPDNPKAYHLLARINLRAARGIGSTGDISEAREYSSLAELIIEHGLSIVDQHAGPLVDDILAALHLSGKKKKYNKYLKKLKASYRVNPKNVQNDAELLIEDRRFFSRFIVDGFIVDDET